MAEAPGQLPSRSDTLAVTEPAEPGDLDLAALRTVVEEQVRTRPLLSVAAALAFGFLLGRLIRS